MRKATKVLVAAAVVGAVSTSLAACSRSGSSPAPSGSATPIAQSADLQGVSTSVKIDPTFMTALKTLHLTPKPVGKATLSGGVATFPITGGHVTISKRDGSENVQGEIEHDGSGLSLTAGSTTVEMTNFVVHEGSDANMTGDITINGKSAGKDLKLFVVDDSSRKPVTVDNGVATLTGTKVEVSTDAAKVLDDTFKTKEVEEAVAAAPVVVGIATVKLKVG